MRQDAKTAYLQGDIDLAEFERRVENEIERPAPKDRGWDAAAMAAWEGDGARSATIRARATVATFGLVGVGSVVMILGMVWMLAYGLLGGYDLDGAVPKAGYLPIIVGLLTVCLAILPATVWFLAAWREGDVW